MQVSLNLHTQNPRFGKNPLNQLKEKIPYKAEVVDYVIPRKATIENAKYQLGSGVIMGGLSFLDGAVSCGNILASLAGVLTIVGLSNLAPALKLTRKPQPSQETEK